MSGLQVKTVANLSLISLTSITGSTSSLSHPKSPHSFDGFFLNSISCSPFSKNLSFAFNKFLNAFVTSAKSIPLGFSIDFLGPPSNAVPEIFFHELRMFTNHCLEIL